MSGHQIQIPHFYCLEYMESDKTMTVEIDFRDPVIYLSTPLIVAWNPPHDAETITESSKQRIIANIRDYLVNDRGFGNVKIED